MRDHLVRDYDLEDIDYALGEVQELYEIKFYGNELRNVVTFGDLIDHIIFKIDDDHSVNCTTQRAFYRIRNAIATGLEIDRKEITPKTLWSDILPESERVEAVQKIEEVLGFQLPLLRTSFYIYSGFAVLCILSFYAVSLHFVIGVVATILFITGFWLSTIFKNTTIFKNIITTETLGEVAEKTAKKHYLQPGRNYAPVNKEEAEKQLTELLCERAGIV